MKNRNSRGLCLAALAGIGMAMYFGVTSDVAKGFTPPDATASSVTDARTTTGNVNASATYETLVEKLAPPVIIDTDRLALVVIMRGPGPMPARSSS